jgi:hypothetical protein
MSWKGFFLSEGGRKFAFPFSSFTASVNGKKASRWPSGAPSFRRRPLEISYQSCLGTEFGAGRSEVVDIELQFLRQKCVAPASGQ